MNVRTVAVLAAVLAVPGCVQLHAADCAALKQLAFPDTTITLAEPTSGTLALPGETPLEDLPAFCRVTGILRPTSDSIIHFEVWLPDQDWNGRLLGTGNGGFAGSIYTSQMAGYLHRGFAVSGSDAGHAAGGGDASWAFGHPEKVRDFGWRAVHLTAEAAKQIIRAYYGKPQSKAYFDACSDGGREALMEAQRFPEDYDGILAGAPAYNWSHLIAGAVFATQDLLGDPRAYIPDLKLPAIQKASLAACDSLDGVKDGVITDPGKCHFDPTVLLCKGDDSPDCLTQPQIDALNGIYTGAKDSHGAPSFPGMTMGDETGWREWIIGEDPGAAAAVQYAENDFRYIVTGDPKWNVLAANYDDALRQSIEKTSADLDASDPDLGRFDARGGKLILYHGWNDQAISPWNTIAYYKSVERQMGAQKVDSFAHLYMAPGMEHCANGPGPSSFGQLGIPTSTGPKFGLFDALENWVEKDAAPGEIVATKYSHAEDGSRKAVMTRPLCPYPKVAKYNGSGDTNNAASFACTAP
ncbi:MAG TPA: tannase/feruloyl esterase family alpha/beta hydrolase [Acidobacteriaceae bacterium]